jgi:hypothetical protein
VKAQVQEELGLTELEAKLAEADKSDDLIMATLFALNSVLIALPKLLGSGSKSLERLKEALVDIVMGRPRPTWLKSHIMSHRPKHGPSRRLIPIFAAALAQLIADDTGDVAQAEWMVAKILNDSGFKLHKNKKAPVTSGTIRDWRKPSARTEPSDTDLYQRLTLTTPIYRLMARDELRNQQRKANIKAIKGLLLESVAKSKAENK